MSERVQGLVCNQSNHGRVDRKMIFINLNTVLALSHSRHNKIMCLTYKPMNIVEKFKFFF